MNSDIKFLFIFSNWTKFELSISSNLHKKCSSKSASVFFFLLHNEILNIFLDEKNEIACFSGQWIMLNLVYFPSLYFYKQFRRYESFVYWKKKKHFCCYSKINLFIFFGNKTEKSAFMEYDFESKSRVKKILFTI